MNNKEIEFREDDLIAALKEALAFAKEETRMRKIKSACGIKCFECPAHIATRNNDQALREKTAAEWTKAYHFNFTADMINCTGCKSDGVQIGYCSMCPLRKCAAEKGVVECRVCAEFKTCKTYADWDAQNPLKENNP